MNEKIEKVKRNYYKIGGGVAMIIGGAVISYFGNSMPNAFVIILGLVVLAGGGYLTWQGWKEGGGIRLRKGERVDNEANCFNIYPDRVAFEYMNNPEGHPRLCLNDNKRYYVQIKRGGKLEEFKLPDVEHGDNPREIGEILQADIIRQCLSYMPTTLAKTIALGILALIIIAEIIGLIAMP